MIKKDFKQKYFLYCKDCKTENLVKILGNIKENAYLCNQERKPTIKIVELWQIKKNFLVILNKGGKRVHIGTFDTIEEAFQAYKTAKEEYIKEVADVWKPLITKQVYQALINYKVEITD